MSFKALNSHEFADYISSYGTNKVPVVFDVSYGPDGSPRTNRLATVGTWTSDQFPHNDQLLAVSIQFQGGKSKGMQHFPLNGWADCFPSRVGSNPNASSQSPSPSGARNPIATLPSEQQPQVGKSVRIPQAEARSLLIKEVKPEYPEEARDKRIQGLVILDAQISEEGKVTHLTLVSGHPLLAPSAVDAVKKWTYRPYLVNGEPMAVETQIDVNFRLPQN